MDERVREYDRFGPWVSEISDEDPVPPVFRPFLTRHDAVLLAVKVPRRIDRREAHPGMDLYDTLVCLYDADMTILQRDGQAVVERTLAYRDVRFIRETHDLLYGNLHLAVPGQSWDLRYNAVSRQLMLRLVHLVRERYLADDVRPLELPYTLEHGLVPLSFYFDGLLGQERHAGSGMRLLAAQGTVPVWSRELGAIRRAVLRMADKRLLETMHLCDGRELKIIGRGGPFAFRWQAVYRTETCYLPLANLDGVGWQADPADAAVVLQLLTSAGSSAHVFSQGNETIDRYAAFLSGLVPPARPATDATGHPRAA